MENQMSSFSNPDVISGYAARTEQLVPGLHHLHRMTGLLLAERAPVDARVLVRRLREAGLRRPARRRDPE